MEHHGTVWFLLSYTLSDEGCSCLWQPRYGPFWIFHISQWKCQRGIPDLERKRGLKLQLPSDLFNFPLRISVYLHFFTKLALNNLINRTDWNVYIYISLYTEQSASFQRGENLCSTLPTWCRKWWKWTEAMPLLGLSWKKARCSKSQKAWLCSMYAYSPDISWHLSYGLNMAKHG